MRVVLQVQRQGAHWAVMHNGGFLGQVATREEAMRLAIELRDFLAQSGRDAEVLFETTLSADPVRRAA